MQKSSTVACFDFFINNTFFGVWWSAVVVLADRLGVLPITRLALNKSLPAGLQSENASATDTKHCLPSKLYLSTLPFYLTNHVVRELEYLDRHSGQPCLIMQPQATRPYPVVRVPKHLRQTLHSLPGEDSFASVP